MIISRSEWFTIVKKYIDVSDVRNSIFKNGNHRHKYLALGHEEAYFVKEHWPQKQELWI